MSAKLSAERTVGTASSSDPRAIAASAASTGATTVAVDVSDLTWRHDHAWRIFMLNQEIIRTTDMKVYMLVVMSTLLVSFSSTNLDRILANGMVHDLTLALLVITAAAFFGYALGTLFTRYAPVLAHLPQGVVFFAHIAGRASASQYCADFMSLDRRAALNDLLEQNADVSAILLRKLTNYRRAWVCLMLQVVIFLGVMLLARYA